MKTFKNLFLEYDVGKAHNPDAGNNDSYYAYQDAQAAAKKDGKVWDKMGKDEQDKYTDKEMEKKGYEKKDGASKYTKISKSPEDAKKDKEQQAKTQKGIADHEKSMADKNAQDLKPREEKSPEEHAKMVDEFVKNKELSVRKFVEVGQASVALEIFIGRQEGQIAIMQDRLYDIQSKVQDAEDNGQEDLADRIREKEYDLDDEIAEQKKSLTECKTTMNKN